MRCPQDDSRQESRRVRRSNRCDRSRGRPGPQRPTPPQPNAERSAPPASATSVWPASPHGRAPPPSPALPGHSTTRLPAGRSPIATAGLPTPPPEAPAGGRLRCIHRRAFASPADENLGSSHLLEQLAQPVIRPVHAHLQCRNRRANAGGDLFVRQLLDMLQDEHFPLFHRQRRERDLQRLPPLSLFE